ncbi:phosphoribosylformylglycinamidine synthase subunit PurL [Candidatus Roizmanbacteria bacterium CG_4_10_14_0_2_um_filter_39_13]|uniref:Phosphoribosylformylglycinamidine synthase subunit PurL n=1 Tax=Candidatus Roizmanbacteria bacterium CG_4_10_14_0_2_um_filter_39_13 TaxID=1974825 RepID=A0A2M7TX40_9BACT|nr:MAG: phosphoribosylformylglycinamidine synthase subunit PurL [Candidatus Roizmanbacteria bacterium CG_4_10_14_0_2_um_filter_39_13]
MIYRIEVTPHVPTFIDGDGEYILSEILGLGIQTIKKVRVVKIFKLEGNLSKIELQTIIDEVLVESFWQDYAVHTSVLPSKNAQTVEIARKPGVMDTEIESLLKAISDLGIKEIKMAGTGKKYIFTGKLSPKQLTFITEKILMNKIVDRVVTKKEKTLIVGSKRTPTQTIQIRAMNNEDLMKLSHDKLWLNSEEMREIQGYFKKERRDPTDVEVEILAQTWSEHCCHKTFNAELIIDGVKKSSLMSRLKKATKILDKKWCLSVFKDNAGVIELDRDFGISGKVETHNSPSAIEPYGGAMTGSGGVFRDIMGCGLGSKVIMSTDMFCVGVPDLKAEDVPDGCIHPKKLLKEVVRGVRDYGNRMGIPTNNGSVHFHKDYRAKPSIIVGAYGIIPKKQVNKKALRAGDAVITIGGKTGRDGIHGVTFASGSMTANTENTSSSAVQIGNAIEEKRMFDAILVCRDKGLLRFAQDCGGGGYSSAIGEIAEKIGVDIHLDRIPLKYPGLASWEIWISESQERMVIVVAPKDIDQVIQICKNFNVDARVLGEITNTKRLKLFYKDKLECDLEMNFLHDGCPITEKNGTYVPNLFEEPLFAEPKNYNFILKKLLASWDVCSKEPIVRQYDHEVQGTSVLKPFTGPDADVPNDAAVIAPHLGKKTGMAVSHGMFPVFNRIDPYWGAAGAIDEAVRNMVAVGVNPSKIALIDNFIWPTPEERELGDLDRAVDACVDMSLTLKMPFVSGKDSLSSTYNAADGTVIKIPPTLCISAFAPVKNVDHTISADFKGVGNAIYIIGKTKPELGGSAYYALKNKVGNSVPHYDAIKTLKNYKKIYQAIQKKLIISAHDCSEGGIAVALTEMCFGNVSARIDTARIPYEGEMRPDQLLFSESHGRIIVEVPKGFVKEFEKHMESVDCSAIGTVTKESMVRISYKNIKLIESSVIELKRAWKKPMKEVFS